MKGHFFLDIFDRSKGVLLGSIIYFIYTPILANLVGPEIFGEFQFIYQLSYFSSLIVSLRVEFFVLRFNTEESDLSKLRAVLVFNTIVLFVLSLIVFKSHKDMIIILSLINLFNVLSLLEQNLCVTQKKLETVGNSELVMKGALIIFSYLAVILEIDIRWAFPIAIFSKLLFLSKGNIEFSFNRFQGSLNFFIASVAKVKYWLFSQSIMTLSGLIPLLFIADSFGSRELGYYTLLISVITGAAKILSKSVADIIVVLIRSSDQHLLRKFMLLLLTSLTLFLFLLYGISEFAETIVSRLMKDEWLPILDILLLVLISSYFAFLSNSFDKVVTFTRFTKYPMIFNACRFFSVLLIYAYSTAYNLDFYAFISITTWVACCIYFCDVVFSFVLIRFCYIKFN